MVDLVLEPPYPGGVGAADLVLEPPYPGGVGAADLVLDWVVEAFEEVEALIPDVVAFEEDDVVGAAMLEVVLVTQALLMVGTFCHEHLGLA